MRVCDRCKGASDVKECQLVIGRATTTAFTKELCSICTAKTKEFMQTDASSIGLSFPAAPKPKSEPFKTGIALFDDIIGIIKK